MASWQQTLALDAKYNAYRAPNNPQFRTLYIRRRSQLLRESAAGRDSLGSPKDGSKTQFRKQYIRLRAQLLAQRYGNPLGLTSSTGVPSDIGLNSARSRTASLASHSISRSTLWPPDETTGGFKEDALDAGSGGGSAKASDSKRLSSSSLIPTPLAEASRAMAGGKTLGENYAFAGMHHVFEHHADAVLRVAFAPDDKERLACCSRDGFISICNISVQPPVVVATLKAHQGSVNCLEWSDSGDQLISGGDDASLRIWDAKTLKCLRVLPDVQSSPIESCAFQPLNNNFVVAGNRKGFVNVFNVSTGKPCGPGERIVSINVSPTAASTGAVGVAKPAPGVAAAAAMAFRRVSLGEKRGNAKGGVTSAVTALAFDDAVNPGAILWAGTESGAIVAVGFDVHKGRIATKTKRTVYISPKTENEAAAAAAADSPLRRRAITSLRTKTWLSREARDPTLLANAGPNALLLFRVLSNTPGALQLRRCIPLADPAPDAARLDGPALPVRANFCPLMSFSEGACVISGGLDGSVNFFDVERESPRPRVNRLLGHAAPAIDVAFNYDESLLASCDAAGRVIVWKREKRG